MKGDLALISNKITVLLSTYNGALFLEEQINSILQQEGVKVTLIIRDDGSTDSTKDILTKYDNTDNIHIFYENNIGVVGSFLWLIDNAPNTDFYALADQDDIWHKDKLMRAINMIVDTSNSSPVLYGANQNCVDKNRNFLFPHFKHDISYTLDIYHVLFRNLVAGCTMVFNKKMINVLKSNTKSREIAYIRMHDTWIMLMALIYGKAIYDHNPCMEYRRHGNNVTNGAIKKSETFFETFLRYFSNLFCPKQGYDFCNKTAKILVSSSSKLLSNEILKDLSDLANYRNKMLIKLRLISNERFLNAYPSSKYLYIIKVLCERI